MAVFRRSPPKSGYRTVIWVFKLAFLLAGILSIAALARIAVPYAASFLASAVPPAWAALRTWLVPPYLFITVHLIIIVIWKLSDHKHHHQTHSWPADDTSPDAPQPLKPKYLGAAPLLTKPSPEIWREFSHHPTESEAATPALAKEPADPSPPSDVSCLTTESDEKSTASSRLDIKKSIAPAPESVEPVEEEEEETLVPVLESEDNHSMDDTWKAIMQRSSSSRSEAAVGGGIRLPEVISPAPSVVDPDEMNRRFEDFIKKKKDEIRLQRHELD
ncbi:putative chromosome alignment-maintaining phosphoprotein 1-like [Cocos nucifera]|uniref:Putative chromosome alignment-maintaining phosphoprotein 1-like n=1 Tax=Cocos nucifera TaxID=13894 RepID=A0A8K0N613_COCNU|nr:putative chromosome alignment-maintaining phosphoprotein 1-like [Cocos nucifera]